jgi:uncharacterized ferritin-like protein (DUF455 family)
MEHGAGIVDIVAVVLRVTKEYGDVANGLTNVFDGFGDTPAKTFVSTFAALIAAEFGAIRGGSLNRTARLAAGFSVTELDGLSAALDTAS